MRLQGKGDINMIRLFPDGYKIIAHPPGDHPDSPIVNSYTAVEVLNSSPIRPGGSRWYGVDRAWIGSDLRMHGEGGCINEKNEVLRGLDMCDC